MSLCDRPNAWGRQESCGTQWVSSRDVQYVHAVCITFATLIHTAFLQNPSSNYRTNVDNTTEANSSI